MDSKLIVRSLDARIRYQISLEKLENIEVFQKSFPVLVAKLFLLPKSARAGIRARLKYVLFGDHSFAILVSHQSMISHMRKKSSRCMEAKI